MNLKLINLQINQKTNEFKISFIEFQLILVKKNFYLLNLTCKFLTVLKSLNSMQYFKFTDDKELLSFLLIYPAILKADSLGTEWLVLEILI